jgi:flagellar biosynthesis protein
MPVDFYSHDEKKNAATKPATAIALDAGSNPNLLPKIVASARGLLAEQILRIAFEHGIKVRQDADLAELLATLDLDHEIPAEAVVAVAEILARVFEANACIIAGTAGEGLA